VIRDLKYEEIESVIQHGKDCYTEIGLPGQFHPVHFRRFLESLFNVSDAIILVDDEGKGAIAGVIYADPYTGERTLQKMFWYVLPAFRGGSVALRLLKELERWGIQRGAIRAVLSQPGSDGRVFQRLGYYRTEQYCSKEL
jgi:GNAT superfamily N-acetyltransferase